MPVHLESRLWSFSFTVVAQVPGSSSLVLCANFVCPGPAVLGLPVSPQMFYSMKGEWRTSCIQIGSSVCPRAMHQTD